jgi:hypothetical protein
MHSAILSVLSVLRPTSFTIIGKEEYSTVRHAYLYNTVRIARYKYLPCLDSTVSVRSTAYCSVHVRSRIQSAGAKAGLGRSLFNVALDDMR